MTLACVLAVILAAGFVQGLIGFGSAMVAMALLPTWIGLHVAAPLVAIIALPAETLVFLRYRDAWSWRSVARLVLGMLLGVPVGLKALQHLAPGLLLAVLGGVIAGYAAYGLLGWRLPELRNGRWAYLAGWLGGLLGGAYNTSGPPVVIYGDCRRWERAEFKGNLQAFFFCCDLSVTTGHALSGNLTAEVGWYFLWALPVVALGSTLGASLDRFIPAARFRAVVLVGLLGLGLRLLWCACS